MKIEFVAYGEAKPQGSKTAGVTKQGRAFVREANPNTKQWRFQVAQAGAEATGRAALIEGAVTLSLRFYFARPKGHFGTGKNADKLKDSAPAFYTKKPDLLKLGRAVEDAMKGIVYRDDSQIVQEHLSKAYGEPARVEVSVATLDRG